MAQEARDNQSPFQTVQNNEILRSSECSKTTVELTFTTLKVNALVLGLLVLFSTGNTIFG